MKSILCKLGIHCYHFNGNLKNVYEDHGKFGKKKITTLFQEECCRCGKQRWVEEGNRFDQVIR